MVSQTEFVPIARNLSAHDPALTAHDPAPTTYNPQLITHNSQLMTELKKTLAFVVVAVLISATAVLATRPSVRSSSDFKEQGQLFFPSFKDPLACKALEVIDYDANTASALPFKVMQKDGKWVIPSHHDYPADAKDRLAKTAAGVMDLRKDVIVSDMPDHWEALGVIDPIDTKATSLKGRGKRVTLKDNSGAVLADFIIGKEVPGQPSQRYVRVPEQKRTYAVNVNVDLSARFADWIETNLLKLDAAAIRKVTFDNHKVDPERGTVTPGDVLTIERPTSTAPFVTDELPPGEEIDPAKTATLTSSLADLKIVGVRAKPAGLTAALKATAEGETFKLTQESQRSLMTRGFYILRDGRLLSNQGDVIVQNDDGIVYTLRFGEVSFATGDALSAGAEEESKSADGEPKKSEAAQESRYLFVTAEFDPKLIPEPQPTPPPVNPTIPASPFARDKDDPAIKALVKAEADREAAKKAEYDKKITAGQARAKELTDRFAAWYYLVPGDAFHNVVLDRAALVHQKPDPSAAPPGGGLPPGVNFPGGGGLPPGFPSLPAGHP